MRTRSQNGNSSAEHTFKLLLAGEHPLILEALKLYFSARRNFEVFPFVIDLSSSIPTRQFPTPDVIILDAASDLFGTRATKHLLQAFPKSKLIGLSASDDRLSVLNLIRAGAHGCLIKACSPAELFRAVETVCRGEPFFSPGISKIIENEFLHGLASRQHRNSNSLTPSERRLLGLIADGFSNKEMAAELNMSVRTIEKYRESLMTKLGIRTVAGLTKFAIRNGISNL